MSEVCGLRNDYVVTLPSNTTDETTREFDFFRLITPEGCQQSAKEQFIPPKSVNPARLSLIRKAFEFADDKYSSGSSESPVAAMYYALRHFLNFCDEVVRQKIEIASLKDSLSEYNLYWKHQINTERCAASTAASKVVPVARIVADILNIDYAVLKEQLGLVSQTPYAAPPDNQHAELRGYFEDLTTIIDQIDSHLNTESRETLTFHFPKRDKYEAAQFRLSRHGVKPIWQAPFIWLREIQLRIVAEQRRFILQTGMNPDTTWKLCFGDLEYLSTRQGYRAVAFKIRADHIVEAQLPSTYLPRFKKYLSFISKLPNNPNRLIFPPIAIKHEERNNPDVDHFVVRKKLKYNTLRKLFKNIDRPTFDGRSLRRNLGVFASRRSDGDPLKTAKALGNSPQVAGKHYGGRGTRAENEVEMTAYLTWEAEKSALRRSTDKGRCSTPKQPKPLQTNGDIKPKCGAENSCFFCEQYRPIDTRDYVFSILSKRSRLQARALATKDPQIQKTITRINEILKGYRDLRVENANVIAELEEITGRGNLHPYFENDAALEEILEL